MSNDQVIERPGLFFCLCGPIGVNMDVVASAIIEQLKLFGYKSEFIHLTDILQAIDRSLDERAPSLSDHYNRLIESANVYRDKLGRKALMAELGFFQIQEARKRITGDPLKPAHETAYIIRQFKRPEEIDLFREVYGKQVFQVSAYMDQTARKTRLSIKMRDYDNTSTRTADFEGEALKLVKRDDNEPFIEFGQRLRDVYPLADVFIDATTADSAKQTIGRFLNLVFGHSFHSPSRDEHGMYVAKSAALRSVDLSRQVGVAIFSEKGEVKVLGCNEVPSPFGGTYWEGDKGDSREFKIGWDTNENFKARLLGDTLKQLAEVGVVDKKYAEMATKEFLKFIEKEKRVKLDKKLMMMDVIEYGRIIHAEMNAITDAARNGIPIDGSTLYSTTFPCHLCAKHIISSGIKRVVYIEPYPKSYAFELYMDDIHLERSDDDSSRSKVYFEPFIGIAPFRYRDLFEKSKRKDGDGNARMWLCGEPRPDIKVKSEFYVQSELQYLLLITNAFKEKDVMLPEKFKAEPDAAALEEAPADEAGIG